MRPECSRRATLVAAALTAAACAAPASVLGAEPQSSQLLLPPQLLLPLSWVGQWRAQRCIVEISGSAQEAESAWRALGGPDGAFALGREERPAAHPWASEPADPRIIGCSATHSTRQPYLQKRSILRPCMRRRATSRSSRASRHCAPARSSTRQWRTCGMTSAPEPVTIRDVQPVTIHVQPVAV